MDGPRTTTTLSVALSVRAPLGCFGSTPETRPSELTGDALVVVALWGLQGYRTLREDGLRRRAAYRSGGWSTSGASSAPLSDPDYWVGLKRALLRRHTWWPCRTAWMEASGDGRLGDQVG